jgi:hypothetical protein
MICRARFIHLFIIRSFFVGVGGCRRGVYLFGDRVSAGLGPGLGPRDALPSHATRNSSTPRALLIVCLFPYA